jgi:plastocyanin domain-containing protein
MSGRDLKAAERAIRNQRMKEREAERYAAQKAARKKRALIISVASVAVVIVTVLVIVWAVNNNTADIGNGIQTITTTANSSGSSNFRVQAGTTVKWTIEAKGNLGCMTAIKESKLNINKTLTAGASTVVQFTPKTKGTYQVLCPSQHRFCTITVY